jgi:hypothetical protein
MVEEENMQLGGNIELSGFNTLKGGEMVVVKKIVGNYARRMEGICKNFNGLKLRLKPLHQTEDKIKKFELHGQVIDDGQVYPAGLIERNLFVGVDSLCKKLVHEIS